MTTGARDGLASTLGDGATKMVEVLASGTVSSVGVMEVVKRRKREVRAWSVKLPTVLKGGAGSGFYSASARFLAARVNTSTK